MSMGKTVVGDAGGSTSSTSDPAIGNRLCDALRYGNGDGEKLSADNLDGLPVGTPMSTQIVCRAGMLAGVSRGRKDLAAAGSPLEDDLVMVKRAGIALVEDGESKLYTSDPSLLQAGACLVQRYDRFASEEGKRQVVIESADLDVLPDETRILLSGVSREIDIGWLRRRRWNIQYIVLLDGCTAERLEIPGDATMACHVDLRRLGVPVRMISGPAAESPAYIDAEFSVLPLRG